MVYENWRPLSYTKNWTLHVLRNIVLILWRKPYHYSYMTKGGLGAWTHKQHFVGWCTTLDHETLGVWTDNTCQWWKGSIVRKTFIITKTWKDMADVWLGDAGSYLKNNLFRYHSIFFVYLAAGIESSFCFVNCHPCKIFWCSFLPVARIRLGAIKEQVFSRICKEKIFHDHMTLSLFQKNEACAPV